MQENEFEKRVLKIMEEWKVRPSVSVWPGVEKRIREKRRGRRWLIIIPMLAGLALGGFFVEQYFLGTHNFHPQVAIEKAHKKQNAQVAPVTSSDEKNLKKISEPEQKTDLISSTPNKKNRSSIVYTQPGTGEINSESWFPPVNKKRRIDDKTIAPVIHPDVSNRVSELEKDEPLPRRGNDIVENGYPTVSLTKADKVNEQVADKETIPISNKSVNDSSVSSAPGKKKSENKIKWGFHFSAGISGANNHLFSFPQDKSADIVAGQNSRPGGSLFPTSFSNNIKAGAGYQAGIVAQKKLSKHGSLSAGLQYDYFSNHLVASSSDSSIRISYDYSATPTVNSSYQNTTRYEYTNHYHFISLPVSYHYYLNPGKNLPLSLQADFVLGRLISTNAMVFDTTSGGIYFRDKNLVRKTQARLSSGFSITLNKNKAVQIVIGPQFEFAITSLYQKRFDKPKYLVYGSMNVNLFFSGK
jgi:hypothetical protein